MVPEKHVKVALHWLNGGEIEWWDGLIWVTINENNIYLLKEIPEEPFRIKPDKFIPKANNWYACELRQGNTGRNGIFFCSIDGCIELPIEGLDHIWKQEDVTITGIVEVTLL